MRPQPHRRTRRPADLPARPSVTSPTRPRALVLPSGSHEVSPAGPAPHARRPGASPVGSASQALVRSPATRRPLRATLSLLAALLLAALLAGCSLLNRTPNRFALAGGAGEPLPATLLEEEITDSSGTWTLELVATEGSLRLGGDMRYEHSLTVVSYVDGQLAGRNLWNDEGVYSEDRGNLQFDSEVVENVSFTGTRGADSVIIQHDLYHLTGEHELVPLEYER